MVQLTIPQLRKEINYLEENYQRLLIKTVEYRAEKKKLEDQIKKIEGFSDKQLVKLELQKKPQKKSILKGVFRPRGGVGIEEGGQVIVGEDNDDPKTRY